MKHRIRAITTAAVTTAAALAAFASGAHAAAPAVTCVGDAKARHGLVYLHGVDPVEPTAQERGNRELLTRLARELGFDLAIARSKEKCAARAFAGKLCWPRGNAEEIEATLGGIAAAARRCFAKDARLTALGFSNGGFLLNHATMQCAATPFDRYVSIGGAGKFDPAAPERAPAACGQLTFLMGRGDTYQYADAKALHARLAALGRDVRFVEFGGGHEIAEEPTRGVLRGIVGEPVAAAADDGIRANCDIPGGNVRSFAARDAADCRDACKDEKACKAFVYVSGWGRCFLKPKAGRQATIRFYAGHVDESAKPGERRKVAQAAHDIDYSGKDMRKLPGTASGQACAEACLDEARCKAFAYIEGYRDCWLKESRGTSRGKVFSCGVMPDR